MGKLSTTHRDEAAQGRGSAGARQRRGEAAQGRGSAGARQRRDEAAQGRGSAGARQRRGEAGQDRGEGALTNVPLLCMHSCWVEVKMFHDEDFVCP